LDKIILLENFRNSLIEILNAYVSELLSLKEWILAMKIWTQSRINFLQIKNSGVQIFHESSQLKDMRWNFQVIQMNSDNLEMFSINHDSHDTKASVTNVYIKLLSMCFQHSVSDSPNWRNDKWHTSLLGFE